MGTEHRHCEWSEAARAGETLPRYIVWCLCRNAGCQESVRERNLRKSLPPKSSAGIILCISDTKHDRYNFYDSFTVTCQEFFLILIMKYRKMKFASRYVIPSSYFLSLFVKNCATYFRKYTIITSDGYICWMNMIGFPVM
jgi:hypothetical protein